MKPPYNAWQSAMQILVVANLLATGLLGGFCFWLWLTQSGIALTGPPESPEILCEKWGYSRTSRPLPDSSCAKSLKN